MNPVITVIFARGHENIQATHRTTFEITKKSTLTKRGDCIIAISATKGAADLSSYFKEVARSEDAQIMITIEAEGLKEIIRAKGSSRLSFTDPRDLVVRKSNYVCGRTIAIKANKAANDLSRKLVEKLMNPDQRITITLTVEDQRT